MSDIRSPGIGSGIDVNSLVTQLIAAEGAPATRSLDRREANLQAELSAFGSLKGALSSFRSSVSFLSNESAFTDISANSSDTDIITASSDSAVDGSYRVVVNQLAEAQSLVTTGFTTTSDIIGTGTLSFKFGTGVYSSGPDTYAFTPNPDKATQTVTIDSNNNTVQGVADAINDANIGATASVIFDGSNYKLTVSSTTAGADNAIELTVADTSDANNTDTNGLSQLAFNASVTNLSETTAAQDALFTVNGLSVTSATNSVKDAIQGLTLNLIKADAAKPVTVTVSRNDGVVSNAARNFVTAYNSLFETVNSLSSYDAENNQGGLLLGDAVIRSVTTQIRSTLNAASSELPGTITSLASIGITTERDGSLKLDNTKLDAAVAADPNAVAALFAEAGRVSNPNNVKFLSAGSSAKQGNFAVNITQVATQGTLSGLDFGYDAATPITVDNTNDDLSFTIDGISTGTITLTQADYTGAQLAVEIQTRINGVSALGDAGVTVKVSFDDTDSNNERFIITSNRYGDGSKAELVSVEGSAFGLAAATASTGLNIEGTIGGFATTGSGRVLTTLDGLAVELKDDLLGDHGSITFSRGLASRLDSLIDGLLDPKAGIESRIAGYESNISDISNQRERLGVRLLGIEERLRAQFTALDLLVSQLNSTSNFLNQQLNSLPALDLANRR
ncbi:Flagellar hook-associated protein FliD [hydrothermal vent metagenome]|uniref:Filament cap protein n=1 Tax=hydrothermal vent metagenome TaxID=652676 RepID=A0A3B0YZY3_9ZZZZ